jgi:hypothetical protein
MTTRTHQNQPREDQSYDKGRTKLAEKTDNLQISLSPCSGASEASAMAATSRLISNRLRHVVLNLKR